MWIPVRARLVLMLGILLTGCQNPGSPVSNVGERGKYHIVRTGETLYSIAFRYGKDYRSLASANGISAPFTIYAGQKIALRGKLSGRNNRASAVKVIKRKQPVIKPEPVTHSGSVTWQWPVSGEILQSFSLKGKVNKGIDIAGKAGTNVLAAAPGVVVYAGGNLRGYGKLVIVKHDQHYLSAYGNNRSIRVKEGDTIKAGQKLAEVGVTSTNIELLHFEIRRDGKPVDPLGYLPASQ